MTSGDYYQWLTNALAISFVVTILSLEWNEREEEQARNRRLADFLSYILGGAALLLIYPVAFQEKWEDMHFLSRKTELIRDGRAIQIQIQQNSLTECASMTFPSKLTEQVEKAWESNQPVIDVERALFSGKCAMYSNWEAFHRVWIELQVLPELKSPQEGDLLGKELNGRIKGWNAALIKYSEDMSASTKERLNRQSNFEWLYHLFVSVAAVAFGIGVGRRFHEI